MIKFRDYFNYREAATEEMPQPGVAPQEMQAMGQPPAGPGQQPAVAPSQGNTLDEIKGQLKPLLQRFLGKFAQLNLTKDQQLAIIREILQAVWDEGQGPVTGAQMKQAAQQVVTGKVPQQPAGAGIGQQAG